MSRDYTHEDWIPWYTRDTAGWLELSLAARGCAEGIARKMGRDRNELPLGSRGLKGLAALLGRPWSEVEPAILELLAPGPDGEPPRLIYDEANRVLRDPEASSRARPKSTGRVQAHRKRRSSDETRETVSCVSLVSKHDETPVAVSSLLPLISSDLEEIKSPEENPSARTSDHPPASSRTARDYGTRRFEQSFFTTAFAEGVTAVSGVAYVVPRGELRELDDAIDGFAPFEDRETWVRDQARAFRLAVRGREQYHRGGGPRGWLEWLGLGAPSAEWLALTPAERESQLAEEKRRHAAAARRKRHAEERAKEPPPEEPLTDRSAPIADIFKVLRGIQPEETEEDTGT